MCYFSVFIDPFSSINIYSILNMDPDNVPHIGAFADEFKRIADRFMNDFILVVNNHDYRVCEVR